MGISGLLPLLKEIQVAGNISEFKGKRLAVDAYVWLHKGAFGCAEDLVKGRKTTKFVDYAMYRVRLLRYHGITPYIVFDGGPLPAKRGTEDTRAKSRAANLARATTLESQGRLKEARDYYTKCIDITPEMAYQLIKALRAENVEYVVAPYEADAQLCFLEREGYVDGIITEDSDLLVFGCKQVIFKMDGDGQCVHIHRDKLATIRDFPMHGWTDVQFRRMAMMSGCDYLESIQGIGLKTAHRLLRRFKTVEKSLQSIRLEGVMTVPDDYAVNFAQAELAFIHQRIFDPEQQRLVPLNDFPGSGLQADDEKWIGLDMPVEIAQGIASGDLHPETRLPIEDQWPEFKPIPRIQKIVLGESSKVNEGTGPMDAFISRSKRPRTAPLPKPVGTMGSGPSRLSDLPVTIIKRIEVVRGIMTESSANFGEDHLAHGIKKSKFFSAPAKRRKVEVAQEKENLELVWERSDEETQDVEEPVAGPSRLSRSPSLDQVRSPSPILSSIRAEDSPVKPLPESPDNLTSPPAPHLSSPLNSPMSDDVFSPPHLRHSRQSSPESPSKQPPAMNEVLIDPSSQPVRLNPTPNIASSQMVSETPVKKDRFNRTLTRLSGVLIPSSSPGFSNSAVASQQPFSHIGQSSSDSIEEDEVVTPFPEVPVKRKSPDGIDDAEMRREEKARVVAAGWKEKYAFKTDLSFPSPSTTRKPKATRTTSAPSRSTPVPTTWPSRQPKASPMPLSSKSLNIPSISKNSLPRKMSEMSPIPLKAASTEMTTKEPNSSSPPELKQTSSPGVDLTWSILERYRFAGKVKSSQEAFGY